MKKYVCGLVLVMGAFFSISAQAKPSVPPGMAQVSGQYYEVLSDGGTADAQLLARELDSRFLLYNKFFHFNMQKLGGIRLKVRSYKEQSAYDAYIGERLDKTSPGAVYLHYSQPERRELVIHRGSSDEGNMFPHQAFIQYLRAFISSPPSWLMDGFAIYFSTLKYEALGPSSPAGAKTAGSGGLVYEENLYWLEIIKSLGNKAPSLEAVLLADNKGAYPDNFQGVSWALISFLKDSGKDDYLRFLYESFILMDHSLSAQDNSQILYNHIRTWTDVPTLDRDYKAYLLTRKTFMELVTEGQRAYNAKDTRNAETVFLQAVQQRPTSYVPYYYLGLLAYDSKNYVQAEQYYQYAQQYGGDPALITYALGINAVAVGDNSKAIKLLEQAKTLSPGHYTEQVDNLIKRLR